MIFPVLSIYPQWLWRVIGLSSSWFLAPVEILILLSGRSVTPYLPSSSLNMTFPFGVMSSTDLLAKWIISLP